jgi:hypothetical protein
LGVSRQGEFKNTIQICLQKVHVEKKIKNFDKKFDVSFSSTFLFYRVFGVFTSVRLDFDTTFSRFPFGASAWSAQSALLQSRLSFAGAPAIESPAGANSAGISNDARVEIHTQAALQSTNFNDT